MVGKVERHDWHLTMIWLANQMSRTRKPIRTETVLRGSWHNRCSPICKGQLDQGVASTIQVRESFEIRWLSKQLALQLGSELANRGAVPKEVS